MKRILTIILLFITVALHSQEVTLEKAMGAASFYVEKYFPEGEYSIKSWETYGKSDSSSLFLFRVDPEGWILLSGNLGAEPVLGFDFTGDFTFPAENRFDQRYYWIESYVDQVEYLNDYPVKSDNPGWDLTSLKSETLADLVNVSPFIHAKWNQGAGWNRFCPEDAAGPGGHAYVGCVAVAIGQALSVFDVPERGKGTHSYISDTYGALSADFGSTEYYWNRMSNISSDDYNSLLLYHCAVAVDMDFGPDGSGAQTSKSLYAMTTHFYMSQKLTYKVRKLYSNETWNNFMLTELQNNRPIIYKGDANNGEPGHAFNLDGVIDSKYYHVNWGWGGSQNGYYLLDALKPGTGDYTQNQAAVLGIRPYYYPTDILLSNKVVPEDEPAGTFIGKVSVTDEARDNEYTITLKSDSTFTGAEWVHDYYYENDSLKTGIIFPAGEVTKDTVWFTLDDAHNNHLEVAIYLTFETTTSSSTAVNLERMESFSIYPNPAGDQLYIKDGNGFLIKQIRIYNLSGQVARSFDHPSSGSALSLAGLHTGIYILEATYRDGVVVRKKVVKN